MAIDVYPMASDDCPTTAICPRWTHTPFQQRPPRIERRLTPDLPTTTDACLSDVDRRLLKGDHRQKKNNNGCPFHNKRRLCNEARDLSKKGAKATQRRLKPSQQRPAPAFPTTTHACKTAMDACSTTTHACRLPFQRRPTLACPKTTHGCLSKDDPRLPTQRRLKPNQR